MTQILKKAVVTNMIDLLFESSFKRYQNEIVHTINHNSIDKGYVKITSNIATGTVDSFCLRSTKGRLLYEAWLIDNKNPNNNLRSTIHRSRNMAVKELIKLYRW